MRISPQGKNQTLVRKKNTFNFPVNSSADIINNTTHSTLPYSEKPVMKIILVWNMLSFVVGGHIRRCNLINADNYPTHLTNPTATRSAASCPSFKGFVFWPSDDSAQCDIGRYTNTDLSSMAADCGKNSNCTGFNTNGWYKWYIQPLRDWVQWTSHLCKGLYIKVTTKFKG